MSGMSHKRKSTRRVCVCVRARAHITMTVTLSYNWCSACR